MESASHVEESVDYTELPPTSGDHDPCWAEWGVHTEELRAENWVHNMEHGGVIFLYNCPDGCADDIEAMSQLVEEFGEHYVLTPYSLMDSAYAVVAWEHRLLLGCADIDAMRSFYLAHVDQGPESTTSPPAEGCMD